MYKNNTLLSPPSLLSKKEFKLNCQQFYLYDLHVVKLLKESIILCWQTFPNNAQVQKLLNKVKFPLTSSR